MIVNLATYSDSDFERSFIYRRKSDNSAINLLGSTLRMMVRAAPQAATAYIELSTLNGFIAIDYTVVGKFDLRIPFSELANLSAGIYVHSLIRTRPDTIREPIWRGTLTHSIGPTR